MRFDDILRASIISLLFLLLMMISFNNVSYGCDNPVKRGSFTVCTDSQRQLTWFELNEWVMKHFYMRGADSPIYKCTAITQGALNAFDSNTCINNLNATKSKCYNTLRPLKDITWNDLIGYCQNLE